MKCENCEKECEEVYNLCDIDGDIAHENLCSDCKDMFRCEAEPNATVFYNDDEYPHYITDYDDYTEGDFSTKWISTDAWRGHFDVIPSDDWVQIHTDAILSYSYNAEQLKEFDDKLQEMLLERNIKYARVFTRSSNVFSTNHAFFVEKGKGYLVRKLKEELEQKYRDPERFMSTALTGKDPDELDENDKMFLKVVGK